MNIREAIMILPEKRCLPIPIFFYYCKGTKKVGPGNL